MRLKETLAIKDRLRGLDTIDDDNLQYILQEVEKENVTYY